MSGLCGIVNFDGRPVAPELLKKMADNIKAISDLVRLDESELLKFRNFGRKSLQEIQDILEKKGLYFGMDVDKYLKGED